MNEVQLNKGNPKNNPFLTTHKVTRAGGTGGGENRNSVNFLWV